MGVHKAVQARLPYLSPGDCWSWAGAGHWGVRWGYRPRATWERASYRCVFYPSSPKVREGNSGSHLGDPAHGHTRCQAQAAPVTSVVIVHCCRHANIGGWSPRLSSVSGDGGVLVLFLSARSLYS
jgi:hypothetical protein